MVAADGWSYERKALEKLMARGGLPKSPVAGHRFWPWEVFSKCLPCCWFFGVSLYLQ